MQFKQLSIAEFRQDAIGDFNIMSNGFCMALAGATGEIPMLELNCSVAGFPFTVDYMQIPLDRPSSKLIENVDVSSIYATSNVTESQELSLDPVYVADYSFDPPKPKAIQVHWSTPICVRGNEQTFVAIVTSYGACQVRSKDGKSRQWNKLIVDLNKIVCNDLLPPETSPNDIRNFQELKDKVNQKLITAFAWGNDKHIFIANAAGWIFALHWSRDSLEDIEELARHKTSLNRISYIKSFDDFLLIGTTTGVVKLFRLNRNNSEGIACIDEIECLWSKSDRMSLRKVEVTHSKDTDYYFLVFSKAAHVLAYQLQKDGTIKSSCTLYVGGIKITGIETLSVNEFIVTTINGTVKHVLLVPSNEGDECDLQIHEQSVDTNFDVANHQILGVVATPNRSIWSFMLYRNKDYTHQSKYSPSSAFVSVCTLSTINSLQILSNLNLNTLNSLKDHVIVMRLEIANSLRHESYNNFYVLEGPRFPKEFNDIFLQKLQLKFLILKAFEKFEEEKYNNHARTTVSELAFLTRCLQSAYIIYRIELLQRKIGGSTPTPFQSLVGHCLSSTFHATIKELQSQINDENHLKDTAERYVKLATDAFGKMPTAYELIEQCILCQAIVEKDTNVCSNGHKMKRCCVSFVQLPFFNRRYCPQCNAAALDDDEQLRQVLVADETLKCTFCRFSFKLE